MMLLVMEYKQNLLGWLLINVGELSCFCRLSIIGIMFDKGTRGRRLVVPNNEYARTKFHVSINIRVLK